MMVSGLSLWNSIHVLFFLNLKPLIWLKGLEEDEEAVMISREQTRTSALTANFDGSNSGISSGLRRTFLPN